MADIGAEIASNPVAYRAYRQMASQGVEYGVDFVNRPAGLLGEFWLDRATTAARATTYAGNAGDLRQVVSNMVHESYHATRWARGGNSRATMLEEYGAIRRQRLYEFGRRPTAAERQSIWEQVRRDYGHLPER
jgi:hypothetical protein